MLCWIQSFLADRTQRVAVEGELSDLGKVTSGVPQGSVLGPTLFSVYINDIGENIKSNVRLFADDTILYNSIRNENDTLILQEDLNALEKWEGKWQMSFNVSKCHLLTVTRKTNPLQHQYTLHGQKLEKVKTAKYLGVELADNLNWKDHVHATAKKANRTSAFVYRNLKGCPTDVQLHCYKGLVRPVLEYASPVWDPHQQTLIDTLEAVQKRSARRITKNFDPRASTSEMVKNLGLPTLRERRKIDKSAMVFRIKNKLVDIKAENHFKPVERVLRGQKHKFQLLHSRTDLHLHSFFPSATRLWNSLPITAINQETVQAFKAELQSWSKTI